MKNMMKRIAVLALALVMLFAVTACGSSAADELKYSQDVVALMNELTEASNTFSSDITTFFEDITDENREMIMGDLDTMEDVYTRIKALKAPDKYADFQALLNESADYGFQAIEVYRTELGTVTDDTLDEAFLERVTVGDEHMQNAAQKLLDAAALMETVE